MTPTPAKMLASILSLQTFAGDPADYWRFFYSHLPEAPVRAAAVWDITGQMDGRDLVSGETFEHPGIHVQIRCEDNYGLGWGKIQELKSKVDAIRNCRVRDGSLVGVLECVTRRTSCLSLGYDDTKKNRTFGFSGVLSIKDNTDFYLKSFAVEETPSGTINGVNATFTLQDSPVSSNRLLLTWYKTADEPAILKPGDDFSLSGSTITFLSDVPETGDELEATYQYGGEA